MAAAAMVDVEPRAFASAHTDTPEQNTEHVLHVQAVHMLIARAYQNAGNALQHPALHLRVFCEQNACAALAIRGKMASRAQLVSLVNTRIQTGRKLAQCARRASTQRRLHRESACLALMEHLPVTMPAHAFLNPYTHPAVTPH